MPSILVISVSAIMAKSYVVDGTLKIIIIKSKLKKKLLILTK